VYVYHVLLAGRSGLGVVDTIGVICRYVRSFGFRKDCILR
jgi:hypothetical protein